MSHDVSWDVNKYREEHENEEQWQLRKAFLMKWKDDYPEERLICLARVFTNIEFMGCRYPSEVMHEVARLSADVAKNYRNSRKSKLQRTFVSASVAAGDRAKGVKREGGLVVELPQKKSARIEFVPQGNTTKENDISTEEQDELYADKLLQQIKKERKIEKSEDEINKSDLNPTITCENQLYITKEVNGAPCYKQINYIEELSNTGCLDPRDFNDHMFNTPFGKFVLVIRPWSDMINNLISSCAACNMPVNQVYKERTFTLTLNHKVLARTWGDKTSAKSKACRVAWDNLRHNTVILVLKEQWVSQSDMPISVNDMADKKQDFGEPIEDSVALKMMKLMGWKGGGLGADSQGIAEPIKPNLRMIRRAGLGHEASSGLDKLKRAGLALMRRRGIVLDADLVFAADFSADERAILHQCARQCGLMSKSYGKDEDRFLVVTNKLQPQVLVRAVLECGGDTPKYRVYIPATIGNPWPQFIKQ